LLIVGLVLSFLGSTILAAIAIKSREQILRVSRQRVPVVRTTDRHEKGLEPAYDEAIMRMPEVQARLRQSKVAIVGLVLLTIGFLLQLISQLISII